MSKSLEELYLEWLYDQVRIGYGRRSERTYWDLLRHLHSVEFVWNVANDDNRVSDGLDLRAEFVHYMGDQDLIIHGDARLNGGVTVLEVLIGLSRRLAFAAEGTAEGWAWQLIENLELHKKFDPVSRGKHNRIQDACDMLIWRTYAYDGQGGFFPLIHPEEDQRKVELWYQMAAYINEQHPM